MADDHRDVREVLAALIGCCFPDDAASPTAQDIGILDYFERNLLTDRTDDGHWYRDPPFAESTPPELGWQFERSPEDYFAATLREIDRDCRQRFGVAFPALDEATKITLVVEMQQGRFPAGSRPSSDRFFRMLSEGIQQAILRDPFFGGNRDHLGWKWLGLEPRPLLVKMQVRS